MELIQEEQGYSKEVNEYANKVAYDAIAQLNSSDGWSDNGNGLNYLVVFAPRELLGIYGISMISVTFYAYDGDSVPYRDAFYQMVEAGLIENEFLVNEKRISVTVPWRIDQAVDSSAYRKLVSSLNHEILHALQYNGRTIDSSNGKGTNPQGEDPGYYESLMDVWYFFSKDEIGAWLQGLYSEAMDSDNIKDTRCWRNFKTRLDSYKGIKWFYDNMNDGDKGNSFDRSLQMASQKTGLSPDRFFSILDRNVTRARTGLMKTEYLWMRNAGKEPNGSFRNYSSGEVASQSPFNKPKGRFGSILRNLFRR